MSAMTVGNGEFAFTSDITGLQTFPRFYDRDTQAAGVLGSTPLAFNGALQDSYSTPQDSYNAPQGLHFTPPSLCIALHNLNITLQNVSGAP